MATQNDTGSRKMRVWIGGILTPIMIFLLAAGIMVALEVGAKIGIWSGLISAMPFLTVLGTGIPALLAFAAILAGFSLIGYLIGVAVTHVLTPKSTQATSPKTEHKPEKEPKVQKPSFQRPLSPLAGLGKPTEPSQPAHSPMHNRVLSDPIVKTVNIDDLVRFKGVVTSKKKPE